MLDRTIAPTAGEIIFSGLTQVNQHASAADIDIFWLNAGDQPVVKIELVFESGIWYESKKSVSWLTAKMLAEGTKNKSARQVTEGFEKLGAFLEINPGFDDVSFTVYGLKRNFGQVVSLLNEIINEPTFPEQEFGILKSNRKDQIALNDNKSNLFASKKLREAIYGASFAYGQALSTDDIENIQLVDIKKYYAERLFHQPKIYLSGQVDEQLLNSLESQLTFPPTQAFYGKEIKFQSVDRDIYVKKEGSMQSSIRMAWLIPDKTRGDYFNYQISNSLLGGYFGSRLMKNIREEKGYTYGISSYPIHLKHSSFGMISADVVAEHTKDTFSEIKTEIDKLLNKSIPSEEIVVLTNYLSGSFLASIGTPFHVMEKFKKVQEVGLDASYYDRYFDALRNIDEQTIKSSIEKHFNTADAYTTIVGLNQ
ncbi:Predicted Zn-dependent peptidase [Reichenbachiella faecimaris]|uniref:Predicted Zn-dependent peptidase n=1 Tax=Reichenbachiella faecimaris TaxID=692418 RepID=A0A1W2GED8_REIFA|nr:pitrilysin family protein [Reichenbachiella faecimaris]SMD35043.1 Predicted Zn-dependent peptidase [Reichenbachiella faecimaris]